MMIHDTAACAARSAGTGSEDQDAEGVDQEAFFALMGSSVWY